MTIAVLGLDAVDYTLAEKWKCENILLDNHRDLETESHSLDVPATIEVWPTIATGKSPSDHGVLLNPNARDDGLPITLARGIVELLPSKLRERIINAKDQMRGGARYPTTDLGHTFESGVVKNWPGITPCTDWATAGQWFKAFTANQLNSTEFRSRYLRQTGEQLGWLVGATEAIEPIAGIHVHILDHMGHVYAERPDKLRWYYELVDELIGMIRDAVPDLVILSDHGMQTTAAGDDEPGVHSTRALVSSTINGVLPASIYEVRPWLEQRIDRKSSIEESGVDAPIEHLEDLGYL